MNAPPRRAPAQAWTEHLFKRGRPSLHRRLLAFLLIPLTLVLLVDAAITYGGALIYSNHLHDRDLADTAITLAQMLNNDELNGKSIVTAQARFLLEYDPDGRNYFSVVSQKHGPLAGSDRLAGPRRTLRPDQAAVLYNTQLEHRQLRAAAMMIPDVHDPSDLLTVIVAETLHDRHERAREILLLTIPAQTLVILSVFALVWFGVSHGLRQLDPLTARLAAREHDLAPIGDADVPIEILPLTRTIDDLFARLRGMLALQERFIADAAHQLRTPLAGLRVHAERLQADRSAATVDDALAHIQRLTERATRTSTQLLAMTRAQSARLDAGEAVRLDLAKLIPDTVSLRVHEALHAGVDLGYDGPPGPLWTEGDPATLQELLDNLIDNSLRYGGRGSTVTVQLLEEPHAITLSVEDNGPGVPAGFLARLGERFFRVPGSHAEGTGLGLAIVQRIAEWHHATVRYLAGPEGGLRVELQFPHAGEKNGDV